MPSALQMLYTDLEQKEGSKHGKGHETMMKLALIAFFGISILSVSQAAEYTWISTTDTDWGTASNWENGSAPGATFSDCTINITNGGTAIWSGTDGDRKSSSTTFNVQNNSTLQLGTKGANSEALLNNPRFDGSYNIGYGSTVTVCAGQLEGTSNIYGTLIVHNQIAPATDNITLNFGQTGQIVYADGSRNGIEGNTRTITLSATLDTWAATQSESGYEVVTRYLIAGDSGNDFSTTLYQSLTLAGGTIVDTANNVLTKSDVALTASAEDLGKYYIVSDSKGIGISYVTVPEPATATLSLLALAGLATRRRRKQA